MSGPEALEVPYPAPYTFRVIGKSGGGLETRAPQIIESIVGPLTSNAVSVRPSHAHHYVAVHITCVLQSEDQRRAVYAALHADPDVKLLL